MNHAHIQRLCAHLEEQRGALLAEAARFTQAERLASRPGGWSVDQVLEHVARVDGMVTELLRSRAPRLPRLTAPPAHGPDLDRLGFMLSRRRRVEAVAGSEPRGLLHGAELDDALTGARDRLLNAVSALIGFDAGAASYPHPILGELDLLQWVVFAGYHDGRHALQLREWRMADP